MYYYYDKNIDKMPCPVKVIQTGDKGKRVEISRDPESVAGFWVNTRQLLIKDKEVMGRYSLDVFYKYIQVEDLINTKNQ